MSAGGVLEGLAETGRRFCAGQLGTLRSDALGKLGRPQALPLGLTSFHVVMWTCGFSERTARSVASNLGWPTLSLAIFVADNFVIY